MVSLRSTAWATGLGAAPPAGNFQGSKRRDEADPSDTCRQGRMDPGPCQRPELPSASFRWSCSVPVGPKPSPGITQPGATKRGGSDGSLGSLARW